MAKFYIALEVEAKDLKDAEGCGQYIEDYIMDSKVVGVYPEFNTDLDNNGQVIIYTGHIHESHGA